MARAPLFRVAVAAALGLACGCSNCSNGSFLSRLTSPFRRNCETVEMVGPGPVMEGPILADPGACPGPGCAPFSPSAAPFSESAPPPIAPVPRRLGDSLSQPMPYAP
jgi:hypothetical protein